MTMDPSESRSEEPTTIETIERAMDEALEQTERAKAEAAESKRLLEEERRKSEQAKIDAAALNDRISMIEDRHKAARDRLENAIREAEKRFSKKEESKEEKQEELK